MIELGDIIVHGEAELALQQANQKVGEFLDRLRLGDYGDIDQETRQFDEAALKNGGDILGIYETCSGAVIWIVTNGTTTEVILP